MSQIPEYLDALNAINTYSLPTQVNVPSGEKVAPPTWAMFDFFSKLFLQVVLGLGGKQSPDLIKFHQHFLKFRDIAFSRFCTSSEEKGTIDSYHAKIFQREEKATKDLAALEQQLQFEREERAKAFSRYQIAEQHLHYEEELVKEEALEVEQNLETEFNVLEEHELKTFQAEESNFNAKSTELRTLLMQLQEDHEITQAKLEVYQNYFRNKELEEARKQEEERLKNEAIMVKLKRKENAVVFIQFAWRRHQRRKRAKQTVEKKEKGKEKKGTASSKAGKKKDKGSIKSKAKKGKPKK